MILLVVRKSGLVGAVVTVEGGAALWFDNLPLFAPGVLIGAKACAHGSINSTARSKKPTIVLPILSLLFYTMYNYCRLPSIYE
jgi:hypothetical protein